MPKFKKHNYRLIICTSDAAADTRKNLFQALHLEIECHRNISINSKTFK